MMDRFSCAKQISRYSGPTPLDRPYLSPLLGDLAGLPPLLIQVGEDEVLFDDSHAFAMKLNACGARPVFESYPGMQHVFQMAAGRFPEADLAIASIGGFLKPKIARPGIFSS